MPERKDAFSGPEIASGVAEVYAILGDDDRAIETLDGLLSRPSGVTVQGLKVNPIWDPLRSDPRFQSLIKNTVPKLRTLVLLFAVASAAQAEWKILSTIVESGERQLNIGMWLWKTRLLSASMLML